MFEVLMICGAVVMVLVNWIVYKNESIYAKVGWTLVGLDIVFSQLRALLLGVYL